MTLTRNMPWVAARAGDLHTHREPHSIPGHSASLEGDQHHPKRVCAARVEIRTMRFGAARIRYSDLHCRNANIEDDNSVLN